MVMPTKLEAMKLPAANKADVINILLVDDDEDCRFLIREAISECKILNKVYEVPDGKTALDFVFRRGEFEHAPRPGLIYLDIEMQRRFPIRHLVHLVEDLRSEEHTSELQSHSE